MPERRRGRRVSAETAELRSAILALQQSYEQMTVRQVFYQMASVQQLVPKTDRYAGYGKVQRSVLRLRRDRELPWDFIADGTRWRRRVEQWRDRRVFADEVTALYRRDRWRALGLRIEVWLEKDALASLLSPTTDHYGVSLMVSRGQSSDTYCWQAAREAREAWLRAETETVVYALYDGDSSGQSAAEQVEQKLRAYANEPDEFDDPDEVPISFKLLAVTPEQVKRWKLPTRPAKREGDPPAVELDAIMPDQLARLVEQAIRSHIDEAVWDREALVEASEREGLRRLLGLNGENGPPRP